MVRYSVGLIKRTTIERQEKPWRIPTLSDVNRFCIPRKNGKIGIISVEDFVEICRDVLKIV